MLLRFSKMFKMLNYRAPSLKVFVCNKAFACPMLIKSKQTTNQPTESTIIIIYSKQINIMNSSSIQVADVNDTIMTEKHLASLPNAGKERLKADYRMYGGLLLLLGLTASYGSFADIVSLAGNPTVNSGLPLANLIAAVVQCFF
jgi:hypothetical protein